MIPQHRVIFSEIVDGTVLEAEAKRLDYLDEVILPMGHSFSQGFSNKCAAAACWNILETCDAWLDEPLPTVNSIYEFARELAGQKAHHWGSYVPYVAEAACRLMDGAAKWMEIPESKERIQTMLNWLSVHRTGILIGMDWTSGHNVSRFGKNDILFPNSEEVAPGHAVGVIGAQRKRFYREGFLWLREKSTPVFAIENTHRNTDRPYFIQIADMMKRLRNAIVFVPPNYTPT